ncbi:flagellar hook-associated protein 3 [Burkholderia glumae]|uniref:flagellar hook-associated protein FlgL n=1 Tax=Burkholderia glumae TaxID=337 RepID=UPI002151CB98|nr:flagellar hook-associated protein FlgL [Burkholderia glumae]UVS85791.1 flagellar hook-associated protein 3 [Burkholderia glumae]
MRISTSQFYTQNIELMNNQQSQLSELYQQVASGNTLLTAADDPLGAAQAVQLSASSATLAQYSSNQSSALSSLQLEDKTLSSVTNVLNAVIPSLSGAINGTLSDSDRSALAAQLQGQRDTLLQLANTTDGTGNYLFAGLQSGNQPFTNSPSGGVMFSGDTGQRTVQLSDSVSVAIGDSGARVFTSVPALGSLSVPASNPSNTGTGTIGVITGGTPGDPTNNHAFTVTFGSTTGAPTYMVTDNATTPPTVGTAQTYTAGSAISIGSQSMIISGNPAPGDSFTLTPATQAGGDMIGALDAAIAALKQPVGSGAAAGATLNNALSTALTKMQNAVANVTTVQASVGGREQEVKSMQTITSTNSLQITNSLTDLTQANMPAAITQLLQVQNSLTAAQQAFSKVQGLSLFQYLN